jgi:hypothetical protein
VVPAIYQFRSKCITCEGCTDRNAQNERHDSYSHL